MRHAHPEAVLNVLRPAAALRWLADHPGETVPPMDLPILLRESTAAESVRDAATELIAVKSTTRELGAGQAPALLQRFVDEELARAEGVRDASAPARSR